MSYTDDQYQGLKEAHIAATSEIERLKAENKRMEKTMSHLGYFKVLVREWQKVISLHEGSKEPVIKGIRSADLMEWEDSKGKLKMQEKRIVELEAKLLQEQSSGGRTVKVVCTHLGTRMVCADCFDAQSQMMGRYREALQKIAENSDSGRDYCRSDCDDIAEGALAPRKNLGNMYNPKNHDFFKDPRGLSSTCFYCESPEPSHASPEGVRE